MGALAVDPPVHGVRHRALRRRLRRPPRPLRGERPGRDLAELVAGPASPYAEPDQFLRQRTKGTFADISAERPGLPFQLVGTGRGATFGDYDNDGDIDVVVVNRDGPVRLLPGTTRRAVVRSWRCGSSTSTVATPTEPSVAVRCGGTARPAEVRAASSYLATNDPRLHFGLGAARRFDDGDRPVAGRRRRELRAYEADRIVTIRQGAGRASK